uniref:Uncharacterized protein n=1 Tax=Glycine max TaxID=3847 RepID=A0A368UN22_SOYBN|eukprot:XP_025983825.1 uncharacterized protein LOC106798265 [Glycine max]
MSDHHPRLHHLRSTSHLLKESFSSFSSNFLTFLFLSLLTLSFRTLVETGTAHVTSFIDRDPSLRALLSRLDLAGNSHNHHNSNNGHHDLPSPNNLRHRRRPFLHLTRVGTLDDDFFSGDDDDARSLFGSIPKPSSNATLLALSPFKTTSAFSDLLADDGIRVSQVIRSGTTFNTQGLSSLSSHHDDDDDDDDSEEKEEPKKEKVDLQFFVKGIEVGRRDAAALFFLVSFLSAAYGWVILVFLVTYSWVLGVVFVSVVNDLLGRFSSVTVLVWEGSRLGLKRLSGFILMRWAVRDALTQLLGLWGFEREISGFLFTWFLVDTFVAFIFSVDAWVAIVDSRKSGREIVKEGCYLISTMLNQAIQVKCLEAILCGSFVRWGLSRVCGRSFAKMFQSTMEVYFMVTWLLFYFAARCKDANLHGRRFGQRELEGLVEGHR